MSEAKSESLNVESCVSQHCQSILFFDWGLQLLDKSGYNTPLGPSQQPNIYTRAVKVCARCRTPQTVIDQRLIDLSKWISPEEVDTLIRIGRAVPHAVKDP